jgi:3-oxoadipate enol-lactonase
LDEVGWSTASVLGISFGGMVAQELAVTAPGRLDQLVLLCTSAGGEGGSSYPLHELAALSPADQARELRVLVERRFDDRWLEDHPADRAMLAVLEGPPKTPDPTRERGESEQLQARWSHDVWDRLGAIRCPTFVGCGRYDGIAPLANGEAIASRIPGAELHIYEGGHAFLAQDPRSLTDVVAFLNRDAASGHPPR